MAKTPKAQKPIFIQYGSSNENGSPVNPGIVAAPKKRKLALLVGSLTQTTCNSRGEVRTTRCVGNNAPDAQPDPDPIEDLVDTLDLGAQPEQSESAAPKDQP